VYKKEEAYMRVCAREREREKMWMLCGGRERHISKFLKVKGLESQSVGKVKKLPPARQLKAKGKGKGGVRD